MDIGCGVESKCLAKGFTCTGCTRNPKMPKDGLSCKLDRYASKAEDYNYYK